MQYLNTKISSVFPPRINPNCYSQIKKRTHQCSEKWAVHIIQKICQNKLSHKTNDIKPEQKFQKVFKSLKKVLQELNPSYCISCTCLEDSNITIMTTDLYWSVSAERSQQPSASRLIIYNQHLNPVHIGAQDSNPADLSVQDSNHAGLCRQNSNPAYVSGPPMVSLCREISSACPTVNWSIYKI